MLRNPLSSKQVFTVFQRAVVVLGLHNTGIAAGGGTECLAEFLGVTARVSKRARMLVLIHAYAQPGHPQPSPLFVMFDFHSPLIFISFSSACHKLGTVLQPVGMTQR